MTASSQNPQSLTVNKSISFSPDVLEWLDIQADKRGISRSKVFNDIVRDRMDSAPSGLKHDVEYLLENNYSTDGFNLSNLTWSHFNTKDKNSVFKTVYKLKDVRNKFDPDNTACYVIPTETTRDNLRELFANAVIFNVDHASPVVLLIPYKLNPRHKIWSAFEQYPSIYICTPESFITAIGIIEANLNEKIKESFVGWYDFFLHNEYASAVSYWDDCREELSESEFEGYYDTVINQGQKITVLNEQIERLIKEAGFREEPLPF